MSDIKELKDEELEKVTGGWSQNEDGTYNVYEGETFAYNNILYNVLETKLNATLDSFVRCEYIVSFEDGSTVNIGVSNFLIWRVLYGYI